MYRNVAYLGIPNVATVKNDVPVCVTAVGNYRLHTSPIIPTFRPFGWEDYQLIYIASGKVRFTFDGTEQIVDKGNIVFFRPGETQIYKLHLEDKPETYWVHFTGYDVDALIKKYQISKGENIFYAGTAADCQWIYRQMIRELQLRRANYQEMLNMNLNQLFLIMNRYLQEGVQISNDALNEVDKAIHYFTENYTQPIVIKQYAQEHLMTPCWFIQNFKKITGYSPNQYLVNLRITNAMNLMDNTAYNITQIANAVGYDNALYFSRLFKKHTGLTPSEYKNKKSSISSW